MKITKLKNLKSFGVSFLLSFSLLACSNGDEHGHNEHAEHETTDSHGEAAEVEVEKGPHRGRMLRDGDFALELAIFETGVPPEFRAWGTKAGQTIAPQDLSLKVNLIRLGNKIDNIKFTIHDDALRGDMEIYEPHSFVVEIIAEHQGETHTWKYDNFEGRAKIEEAVADALGIKTEIASPVNMEKTVSAYGKITANPENVRQVSARFDGVIKRVFPSIGMQIKKGQKLAIVESNESLKTYTIKAPISGIIMERSANPGEQTNGRILFSIMNTSSVWAEIAIFPKDLSKVKVGLPVVISSVDGDVTAEGQISQIKFNTENNQAVNARIKLSNKNGQFIPGSFVMGDVKVGEHKAGLAVKRGGLQAFRDFTVVYAKIGQEYEVRMLELGLQAGDWAEVLGGLEPGTEYVSENSYVIKADIEKSGAAHDH